MLQNGTYNFTIGIVNYRDLSGFYDGNCRNFGHYLFFIQYILVSRKNFEIKYWTLGNAQNCDSNIFIPTTLTNTIKY
jgi:hypothetical protein